MHRNLGLTEFNHRRRPSRARAAYRRALRADPSDARVLFEFDQLRKRMGDPPAERLRFLERRRMRLVERDDLVVEYITLLNETGRHADALTLLTSRRFHPWEGGEGHVSGQWVVPTASSVARRWRRATRLRR